MKFKIGDKVKLKGSRGPHNFIGTVIQADPKEHVLHGIFKIPVLKKDGNIHFHEKNSLDIIEEPDTILKSIL